MFETRRINKKCFFSKLDYKHPGYNSFAEHRSNEGRVHCSVSDGDRPAQAAQDSAHKQRARVLLFVSDPARPQVHPLG